MKDATVPESVLLKYYLDHIPQTVGNTLNAAQDTVSILCCEGTLLAHNNLVAHQDPKILLGKAAFQTVALLHVLMHEVILHQMHSLEC